MYHFSIVLPVKNEGQNLIELCESIARQCCKEYFEVVIVDDSDPGYEEHVTRCINIMKDVGVNVKLLRGERQGVGAAMYKGLMIANGTHILFLDADNILREGFMSKVIPLLTKGSFVSVLSKGIILRGWRGLYYASQLLATLRKGLVFHRRYGFVNILYIWQRDLVSALSKIIYSKLSLLDQIDVRKLIELHITKTKNHGHIDEVLIEDHRHVYEASNLSFNYRRLRWYWGLFRTIRDVLKLTDVKIYLLLLPLTITLTIVLAATLGSKLLLALISIYLVLLGITETIARLPRKDPLIELFVSITWLPPHLIVKSVLAYAVMVSLVKRGVG
ncbi:MAG: glycosyltransferase [Desulfurococcaceae archaeon]|nr:glycosyltransferase [Desulfurococcaceae archaeon]